MILIDSFYNYNYFVVAHIFTFLANNYFTHFLSVWCNKFDIRVYKSELFKPLIHSWCFWFWWFSLYIDLAMSLGPELGDITLHVFVLYCTELLIKITWFSDYFLLWSHYPCSNPHIAPMRNSMSNDTILDLSVVRRVRLFYDGLLSRLFGRE